MADILIRDMEMPQDCGHCRFAVDGWCYAYGKPNIPALAKSEVSNFCPLVPLPEGHGRLGDLDALFEKMYHLSDNEGAHKDSPVDDALILRDSACYIIEDATTIVPAEGDNADG